MDAVRRTLPATQILEGIDALLFADETDRQLAHMYASPHFLSDFKLLPPSVNVFLARSLELRGLPLLYQQSGDGIQVLNEQMALSGPELQAFARSMFDAYPEARRVVFPVVMPPGEAAQLPSSQFNITQDMVLPLPATREQYEQALSKSTRSALKRYQNKLEREHAPVQLEILRPGQDDARALCMLERVLELNRQRMRKRGQVSKVDEAEARAVRLSFLRCGMLVLLRAGDEIVAGTINYRFGDNCFLYLLAHDTRYDRYSPGMLCCYLTILECIRDQQREYHFLWGQYEYKFRLLAQQRDLVRLTLYRSHAYRQWATRFGLRPRLANLRYALRNRMVMCALGRGGEAPLDRVLGALVTLLKKVRSQAAG